jgi:hypothetical protein
MNRILKRRSCFSLFFGRSMAAKAKKGQNKEEKKTSIYAGSVDENTLDLSLSALKSVSIPDIGLVLISSMLRLIHSALLSRVVRIDLSSNVITSLPVLSLLI